MRLVTAIFCVRHTVQSGQLAVDIGQADLIRDLGQTGELCHLAQNRERRIAQIDVQIEQATGNIGNQTLPVGADHGNQSVLRHVASLLDVAPLTCDSDPNLKFV